MKTNILKGDYVKIIAGNYKGKTAQVVSVDKDNNRVFLEGKGIGVNKKSVKARKASDPSGIIDMPKSYAISNVMPICAACGKVTRIKHSEVDGKKVRVCECGAVLETKKVNAKDESKKATVRKRKKADNVEATAADITENSVAAEAVETAEAKPAAKKATAVKKKTVSAKTEEVKSSEAEEK